MTLLIANLGLPLGVGIAFCVIGVLAVVGVDSILNDRRAAKDQREREQREAEDAAWEREQDA